MVIDYIVNTNYHFVNVTIFFEIVIFFFNSVGQVAGICMLCELERHVLRSFSRHEKFYAPTGIAHKLRCKYRCNKI